MLEVHYNNPERKQGIKDSSGIRLFYTPTLRKYDVGVIEIGLEYTDKNSIPPKSAIFDMSGYCIAECTRVSLPEGGIYFFASQLHTHLTGKRVWIKHIRGGVELEEVNRDDHYSSDFQEVRLLKRPVHVLPGDVLITTCRYSTLNKNDVTLGGFGINDEMCVSYIHYYPQSELEVCKSSIDTDTLFNYFDYMRRIENDETSIKKSVSENYQSIKWNEHKIKFLKNLYETSPISMQCNRSSGARFPVSFKSIF